MIIGSLGVAITPGSLVHLIKNFTTRLLCARLSDRPSEKCRDAPFLLSTEQLLGAGGGGGCQQVALVSDPHGMRDWTREVTLQCLRCEIPHQRGRLAGDLRKQNVTPQRRFQSSRRACCSAGSHSPLPHFR